MATIVAGEEYYKLDGQLSEIKRQLRQPNGYPYNPELLSLGLQRLIEGDFGTTQTEEVPAPIIAPPSLYPVTDTDLDVMLGKAEEYAKARFGAKVNLRELFALPTELPWKNVIPVFDPGKLDNRAVVKALQGQGLKVWEETDVMKYSGSEASDGPTLHLIENSLRPTQDTMGLSPNQLRKTGKLFLRLRGYAMAFGLRHFVSKDFLDAETFTWFPEDRLSDGGVAYGHWYLGDRGVRFSWYGPDYGNSYSGSRVAIPIPLKP